MTLPYEEAVKVWAARRFGLALDRIGMVELRTDIDGYESTVRVTTIARCQALPTRFDKCSVPCRTMRSYSIAR